MRGSEKGKRSAAEETATALPREQSAADQGPGEVGNLMKKFDANPVDRRGGTKAEGERELAIRGPQTEPGGSDSGAPMQDMLTSRLA